MGLMELIYVDEDWVRMGFYLIDSEHKSGARQDIHKSAAGEEGTKVKQNMEERVERSRKII
jgi:hypothetical protein